MKPASWPIVLIGVAVAVTAGCSSNPPATADQLADQLTEKCASYGFKPDTAAMAECLADEATQANERAIGI